MAYIGVHVFLYSCQLLCSDHCGFVPRKHHLHLYLMFRSLFSIDTFYYQSLHPSIFQNCFVISVLLIVTGVRKYNMSAQRKQCKRQTEVAIERKCNLLLCRGDTFKNKERVTSSNVYTSMRVFRRRTYGDVLTETDWLNLFHHMKNWYCLNLPFLWRKRYVIPVLIYTLLLRLLTSYVICLYYSVFYLQILSTLDFHKILETGHHPS